MSTTIESPTTDAALEEAIGAFTMRFAGDLGAVAHAATVIIGDKLGLYKAIAAAGSVTAAELAEQSGCDARFLAEWLAAQAASEYAHYDASSGRYYLDPAQAACLADEGAPTFLAGGMAVVGSAYKDEDQILDVVPHRRRRRLARAPPRPVRRHRAVLPARLRRQPGVGLDPGGPGARRCARTWNRRRRRGLRPRCVDDPHGRVVSELDVHRLRLPRRLDRHRRRARRGRPA